jgi:hypothetical protein
MQEAGVKEEDLHLIHDRELNMHMPHPLDPGV